MWGQVFTLGTNAKDFGFYDLPSTDYLTASHYGRTWSLTVSKSKTSFVAIQFKPRFVYSGEGAAFQSLIFVNGIECGAKLYTGIRSGDMVVDAVCFFVAQPNVTYLISANYDNQPGSNYLVIGDGPLLSILAI